MTKHLALPSTHGSFPPPPRFLPTPVSPADRRRQWPQLDDILARGRQKIIADGCTSDAFCILTSTAALNYEPIEAGGPDLSLLLLFVVPEAFAPQLEQLAIQTPEVFNYPSIDLLACDTLFEWRATAADGQRLSWCLHRVALDYVLINRHVSPLDTAWIPVVFVAGERLVCGGFWCTDDFLGGAQGAAIGTGENYNPTRLFDDAELDAAAEKARALGATRPWQDRYWPWADGGSFMMLPVLPYGPLSTPTEE